MRRPDRILLLRTGRHLGVALAALGARWPGCEIAVVGTPGSEPAIAAAGVPPALTFVYDAAPTFQPRAFWSSRAARAARRRGFDRVAVLWNDPAGSGQGNVDRTAFWLAPRGFVAVTPDGQLVDRSPWPHAWRQTRRAVLSVLAAPVLGLLFVPGWLMGWVRAVRS
jgi:hypothetical protein